MAARSRLAHLRPPRKWLALDGAQTVVLALVLFASVYTLQANDTDPADALEVLYVVPIALLALGFGLRGGLAGALAGLVLIGVWDFATREFDVSVLGNACWAIAFLLLGTLLGRFVDHRIRLEAEISRYFESSLDILATIDSSGRFTRVNPACERTLGYSAQAMRNKPTIDFVHPDDLEATAVEHDALAGSAHETVGFRNRFRAADGSFRWLEWSATGSPQEGLIYATARDVSAQVEAERQLANHAQVLEREVGERTRELENAHAKALKRLSLSAEYRDDETFHHTERVGVTAAEIAARLGLDESQARHLRQAAPLHDIGKLAIPDRILLKPGKLSPQEFEIMKTHAARGAELLHGSDSPVLEMATVIAASHHERWDGSGYPASLAGEAIPLVGRIVAVADVFDALTHDRPYKTAWTVTQALAEIENGAGSQFDPRVVAAFLAIHEDAAPTRERAGSARSRPRLAPPAESCPTAA
jgi:PAS domain S-box-containing protein/putative nucleotidyltransferase with HDIG domain